MIPREIIIPLGWLQHISSQGLLTFFAIFLAFLAYRKSLKDKYDSWHSLLQSFSDELEAQSNWLVSEYHSDFTEKVFYSPEKIVYKLSFESAKEITRRGINDLKLINKELAKYIAIFNERIDAFNALLEYQRTIISTDPVMSRQLIDELQSLGLSNESVSFVEFSNKLLKLKYDNDKKNLYLFAQQIYLINKAIHLGLIGDKSSIYYLHSLYNKITNEIRQTLDNINNKQPWYLKIKYSAIIIILSIIFFIVIENILI